MKISDLPHQADTRDPTIDPETERLRALNAKQRRDRIAEGFAFALVSNTNWNAKAKVTMTDACGLADILIDELDRT